MLHGAIAAAVTPLRDGGSAVDDGAFASFVRFLADGGVDGVLACGTTGEGILLTVDERKRTAERFVSARPDGFLVAVHAGAQTTDHTVALSTHAKEIGADAVAVIAPPYFPLDDESLFEHLRAAADACAPLPFYPYEFEARSGYRISIAVIERLRETTTNLAGLKVSDRPFEIVRPYLIDGLDLFVGSEPLVLEGLGEGAAGAVSGLATAFPEVVSALVHGRSDEASKHVTTLRELIAPPMPFISAMKVILGARGVPVRPDVRAPLRPLTPVEREGALAAARRVGSLA
jgi:dihydrodipicolinate synthase/N-acetylneuraminate lyase